MGNPGMDNSNAPETCTTDHTGFKLEHKTIGKIRGQFNVPDYQRGYRWDSSDVTHLLDDIYESQGNPYSLQPVVVKLRSCGESENKHQWELIDGQQRLTTLYLILQYMKRNTESGRGAPYTLKYDTRPNSECYLESLDEPSHKLYIDYYHLYQANRAIDAWFQKKGDEFDRNNIANKLHGYLFDSVRIIWYEIPTGMPAAALFIRLNVGRIPLTDAELIKAALLSKVREKSLDRAQEIAAQWDTIERDLHQRDIWAFVAGVSADTNDEQYPTRISLPLDTVADHTKQPPKGKRPRYYTFDTLRDEIERDAQKFWKQVIALHSQILGWFEQPKIYNKIGFLVASGASFGDIALESKGKKKSKFDYYLTQRIRDTIDITEESLKTLSYDGGYPKLLKLLLLMNVETTSRTGQRFPFSRHLGPQWSLEHIHAQNAESLKKREQWKVWLEEHEKVLNVVKESGSASEVEAIKKDIKTALVTIASNNERAFTELNFGRLSRRVLELWSKDDEPDHLIHNMALLAKDDNSRLNNSVFEVKRQVILELDRAGRYVPICTRNVFLKYYADADAQQPHFWSPKDKESYFKAICDLLRPYLQNTQESTAQ